VAPLTQDGARTVADEVPLLLPQRQPCAGPSVEPAGAGGIQDGRQGADPPRRLPDLDVLRQVLAALRQLD
jgi:hypothetical protein